MSIGRELGRLIFLLVGIVLAMSSCAGDVVDTTPTSTASSVVTSTSLAEARYSPQPGTGIPVVVDYNPTSSDVAALLFLLQHDAVRVDAITIPGTGESHCGPAVANTLGLLALVGRESIPVACGSSEPVAGDNDWPADWRDTADELPGLSLPIGGEASELSGPELLVAAVTQSSEPVRLLTLGPLTNVAEALELDPTLVTNLDAVYIMGGAVETDGNVFANEFAEWNVWIDPAGTQILLESGAPVVLLPLDATNDVPVTRRWVDRLDADRTTPAASAVFDLFSSSPGVLEGGFYFWDELAAAVLTDHSYVTLADATVSVVQDGLEEGRTKPDPNGVPVQVAVAADALRFERDLLSILNGQGPVAVTSADPVTAAYFEELEAIAVLLDTTLNDWFATNEGAVDLIFESENAAIEEVHEVMRDFVEVAMDALRQDHNLTAALDPPTEVREAHLAYLAAEEVVLSLELDVLAQVEAAGPGDTLEIFETELGAAFENLTAACFDLQKLATEQGVDVELACSGE